MSWTDKWDDGNFGLSQLTAVAAEFLEKAQDDSCFSISTIRFSPPALITHLVTTNHLLVMGLENGSIGRLNEEEDLEVIEISPKTKTHKVFLDGSRTHLVISMANDENYYMHAKWKKPKPLKLRGIIESVAWDKAVTTETSVSMLLGMRAGTIYEGIIETKETLISTASLADRFKLLTSNDKDPQPVTGLAIMNFPGEASKYFVMVSTPSRILQLTGGPTYDAVFQLFGDAKPVAVLPNLPMSHSELHLFTGLSKAFAWLGSPGIYHGDLVFGSQNTGLGAVTDARLLELKPPPRSCILTEFHFIVLWSNKLQAISRITNDVIYESNFDTHANNNRKTTVRGAPPPAMEMLGLCHDPVKGIIFAYSATTVFEVHIKDEDKHACEQYLAIGKFEQADQHAKTPQQKDKVAIKRAEYNFEAKQYTLAAKYYAESSKSFEEIALKFIEIKEPDALRAFLKAKLKKIPDRDKTQQTMVVTWLTELYIDKLNNLTYASASGVPSTNDKFGVVRDEFHQFLDEYKDKLDSTTTFHLLASHGRVDELLYYAEKVKKDYEKVIVYHLQQRRWKEALQLLSEQPDLDEKLFYKHCPVLMEHLPSDTVNMLINNTRLEPRFLLPSLMRYEAKFYGNALENRTAPSPAAKRANHMANESIRYLNYVVTKGNRDPPIHNYLLALYSSQEDETPLLTFLQRKDTAVDLQYALRLCSKRGKVHAQVHIYSKMKLYEEAVDLALSIPDINLAKSIADQPKDDRSIKESDSNELRKKLWLHIARYVVEKEKQIKKAMAFLQDCDLLKIEDILPFFPDFVLIDDFQEEICGSLKEYNKHLETLEEEMGEATESAELIRDDVKNIRNNYVNVEANSKCHFCKYPLMTNSFYVFPCSHSFHCSCLQEEMKKHLKPEQRQELAALQAKLTSLQRQENEAKTTGSLDPLNYLAASITGHTNGAQNSPDPDQPDSENSELLGVDAMMDRSFHMDKHQHIRDQIDSLFACECPLCGLVNINSIDLPFVDPALYELNNSWKLNPTTSPATTTTSSSTAGIASL